MSKLWDIVFPALVISSNEKHCNSCNPYAGYEMLSMPHLSPGDKVLFVAKIKLYENYKGSPFTSFDREFRPEMYRCREADESKVAHRNFWYFEESKIQRRNKISEIEYQRLIGAVTILHKEIATQKQKTFFENGVIISSLGSLFAKQSLSKNSNIMLRIKKEEPKTFTLINDVLWESKENPCLSTTI